MFFAAMRRRVFCPAQRRSKNKKGDRHKCSDESSERGVYMRTYYTKEVNTQILISLMKSHGIRKIIASPGTANINFVASVQQDPYFELYSSVDERSAAYMACGLAAESGEPVALSCTGATAYRNYIPGLTEAYYRKLPVLAIASTQHEGRIGQNLAQTTDRTVALNDMVKLSIHAPMVHSEEDKWAVNVQINRALLELRRHGGGPVLINLATSYNEDFTVRELPKARVIKRVCHGDGLPPIPEGKIAIFVGAHMRWTDRLTAAADSFCEAYNGVVLCDQTSNYRGKYRILANLVAAQEQYSAPCRNADLLIGIGDVSGAYISFRGRVKQEWRVNPDGEVRDKHKNLSYIFEMRESDFFEIYAAKQANRSSGEYYREWMVERDKIAKKIPNLPFSNVWIAQQTAGKIPDHSILYLGILHTLRSWNLFETPSTVTCYCNTGGFGIDGGVSTMLGLSLADKSRLCFGVVGDLGFFYDMNALGNRHIGNNLRLMLINNGRGTEFRNYNHGAARFAEDADLYIAAAGHYGSKSPVLVKHYAEDLGFEYMSAASKDEYSACMERFLIPELTEKPMVFEVFTDSQCESDAIKIMNNLETPPGPAEGSKL